MSRLFFLGLIIIFAVRANAQQDSVVLDELVIEGIQWKRYAAGLKVEEIADSSFRSARSLSALLQDQTSAYVKSYGAGQLATLNIRGTNASQNAIFWQGINTNVTSLGLSDFSLVPLGLVDQVSLQYGASSALFGSDAIGGSIHINEATPKGNRLSGTIGTGSFGYYEAAARGHFVAGSISGSTRFSYHTAQNNFRYVNDTKRNNPVESMENAGFRQQGIAQDIYYTFKPGQLVSAHVWLQHMDRDIQPTMTGSGEDHQDDFTTRFLLKYQWHSGNYQGDLKVGRLEDRINFNGELSRMPRYYTAYEQQFFGVNRLRLKAGLNWQHMQADIDSYDGIVRENRNDVYLSGHYDATSNLTVSVNLRQSIVEGYNPPLTPSLGVDYQMSKAWTWKLSLARSYRVPTLNDRYWKPGGNPFLLPETGEHAESSFIFKNSWSETTLTGYWGDVTNWIIWRPEGSIWTPQNVDQVVMRGLEFQHVMEPLTNIKARLSYTYNEAIRQSSDISSTVNKQLPYTPEHQLKTNLEYNINALTAGLSGQLVGRRFTNADNSESLPGFFLLDVYVQAVLSESWRLFGGLQNILDTSYQLVDNRAMPGRNFTLRLTYNLNLEEKK